MIQKLESAGLGYHVSADETEDKLGMIGNNNLLVIAIYVRFFLLSEVAHDWSWAEVKLFLFVAALWNHQSTQAADNEPCIAQIVNDYPHNTRVQTALHEHCLSEISKMCNNLLSME